MSSTKTLRLPPIVFSGGDNRYPDRSEPLTPGVPAALGGDLNVVPVKLPVYAYYPMLRPEMRDSLRQKAEQAIDEVKIKLQQTNAQVTQAAATLAAATVKSRKRPPPAAKKTATFLRDSFERENAQIWEMKNGKWKYENGKLIQSAVTSFATIVSRKPHPTDFEVTLTYRALQAGNYRSVGFSFDYQDNGNSQDIYTSTNDSRQSVQAFHRVGGKQSYPANGIVYTPLKVGEWVTLQATVLGRQLIIRLNGKEKLNYRMPIARRPGRFALWVHQGAAEFKELRIDAFQESLESLQQRLRLAQQTETLRQFDVRIAKAQSSELDARICAELATHRAGPDRTIPQLTDDPVRVAILRQLQVAALKAQQALVRLSVGNATEKQRKVAAATVRQAERNLAQLQAALRTDRKGVNRLIVKHAWKVKPLGPTFPQVSTGRRAALARWMVSKSNPRTARIAVNHLWGRHFGTPLVATPANFGLNGRKPTHPRLLDWLAAELMDGGWRMKPIHRLIVLSRTYRMASHFHGSGLDPTALGRIRERDENNRYLCRMNARRMEAEVVRDSTIHLARQLDLALGGPEISERAGEQVLRRSIYFRNTPNEKMPLLEVFDVADPNACYRRKESVVPHQALAMMNSGLAVDHARQITTNLLRSGRRDFVRRAFRTVLGRVPSTSEQQRCEQFLRQHPATLVGNRERFDGGGTAKRRPATDPLHRSQENLVHVLLLHNDFVTIR